MKRFGPATYSTPAGAVPSSKSDASRCHHVIVYCVIHYATSCVPLGWHDIRGKQARYSGSTGKIQSVAMQLKQVITESSGV